MNHGVHTRATVEGSGREGTRVRLLVRGLHGALFLLSSLPLGLLWLAPLVALVSVGLPLTIVWFGLPVLALAARLCVLATGVERRRLSMLLGARLPSPYRPLPSGSALARARALAGDPALWRGLLYLVLLVPLGVVELAVFFVVAFSAVLAAYPLWLGTLPDGRGVTWTGVFVADTAPKALLVALVGLVTLAAAAAFVPQVCRAHAALGRAMLGPRTSDRLHERVEALTEARSRAVEAAIAERRRIERDLHDGAQQRLVSLAMALGMARQRLETGPGRAASADPALERATQLVGEAHEEAKRALAEIRDLVRGIHPAVLTDRGLDAAISALAARSSVPTSVGVELEERPPEAVETTAYFVIAEALANAAKHSGASAARVSVSRKGAAAGGRGRGNGEGTTDLLVAEVVDDGVGGADPAGDGLAGLSDRVVALDGRLVVESPAGGPTRVKAELPWGGRGG